MPRLPSFGRLPPDSHESRPAGGANEVCVLTVKPLRRLDRTFLDDLVERYLREYKDVPVPCT